LKILRRFERRKNSLDVGSRWMDGSFQRRRKGRGLAKVKNKTRWQNQNNEMVVEEVSTWPNILDFDLFQVANGTQSIRPGKDWSN